MRPRRRFLSLIALFLTLVLIQFIPVKRTNPPIETEVTAPDQAKAILRKACYDCHSNTTRWPWYSSIAPVSWLISRDVTEARQELNFTAWNRYSLKKQASLREDVWKQVEEGHMPPLRYRLMHPQARLAHAEKEVLRTWATAP